MGDQHKEQRFLDTSVLRHLLAGSTKYKNYFKDQFLENQLLLSKFIKMEFLRSYICNILNFYFLLDQPDIESVADAASVWSDKFKKSELKAILSLLGNLLSDHKYNFKSKVDKEWALSAIGYYVNRLNLKLMNTFKDVGKDNTRCRRGTIQFKPYLSKNRSDMYEDFLKEFNNLKKNRHKCKIEHFFLTKFNSQMMAYIENSKNIKNPSKPENKGFLMICEKFKKMLEKGPSIFTCKFCEGIGDAVIALDALRNIRLECVDHAFDHLCPPISQPYFKHPSQTKLFKKC